MHPKCVCGRCSAPDPAGGAYIAPPDPLAVFEGAASRQERGRGGKWEGRERREGKWTLATLRTDRSMPVCGQPPRYGNMSIRLFGMGQGELDARRLSRGAEGAVSPLYTRPPRVLVHAVFFR